MLPLPRGFAYRTDESRKHERDSYLPTHARQQVITQQDVEDKL